MACSSRLFLLLTLLSIAHAENADWTKQCNKCKCIWTSGRKTADCTSNDFEEIPKDLSGEIREIDFSNNALTQFGRNVFKEANLKDIHKLKFQNCSIQSIHDTAFDGLVLLIELDLSRNKLVSLSKRIFRETSKLRVISFSYNKIKTVERELFFNLTHAQRISLDHNEIEVLDKSTFKNLPSLQHIGLDYNRLKTLSLDFATMPKLNSLKLSGNPWVCDCHLEAFKNHVQENNLNTESILCDAPELYKNAEWDIKRVFACLPKISYPTPNTIIQVQDSNVTLTCAVSGNPAPDVDWVGPNGRTLDKDPRLTKQKYIVNKNTSGEISYNNITIINFTYRDRGDYKCLAKNPGGQDEVNISLSYTQGVGSIGKAPLDINLGLIIGLGVVIVVTLIIIIVILVCFCKRSSNNANNQKRNDDSDGLEEYIGMRNQPEMKKQLLTDVNPVSKPPRVTVPGTVTAGGTEVSDQKRILLDTDSNYDIDDESFSMEGSSMPLMRKSQLLLDDFRQPYPPDLLAFPPRNLQPSPAGSSASTVADTSRLPPHHGPQSPLHSPLYEHLYRTLPISRSQSPFVGPVPPRMPRLGQGYVTIPRRPRQSWSSEPPLSDIGEPLYDNLGARTSINGSFSQSLNKLGETSTPKSNRLFPSTPCTIDPIAEHEPPPTVQTLPRNLNKLSPSRTNWAKQNAEALRSPEKRKSTASLPGTEGKKIPPRPPPKPKKQVANRPLFEDEGEDGTEV